MSPGHTIGWQTFCAEMVHSTAGFSLCLYPTMNKLSCSMKTMYVSKINLLAVHQHCESVSPSLRSSHLPLSLLLTLDPSPLITNAWLLSFLKGFVQSYVWWGKATFGVTVWSSTWWCVNRWVGELLSGMMVFETTPEEAWATLSAINFPDVQVRHHGCFCG